VGFTNFTDSAADLPVDAVELTFVNRSHDAPVTVGR
jgi:hypothetical protein